MSPWNLAVVSFKKEKKALECAPTKWNGHYFAFIIRRSIYPHVLGRNSSLYPTWTASEGFSQTFEMSMCLLVCIRGCVIVPLFRAGYRARHISIKDKVTHEGLFYLSLTTVNIQGLWELSSQLLCLERTQFRKNNCKGELPLWTALPHRHSFLLLCQWANLCCSNSVGSGFCYLIHPPGEPRQHFIAAMCSWGGWLSVGTLRRMGSNTVPLHAWGL